MVHMDGATASIVNFKEMYVMDGTKTNKVTWKFPEKGWKEELDALAEALRGKRNIDEDLHSALWSQRTAFDVVKQIRAQGN